MRDIIFSDKPDYAEQVAKVVSDYNDLVNELRYLAGRTGIKEEMNDIFEKYARSEKRNGRPRSYKDLLGGRFRLTKVVRIDRKDNGNEVFDSLFDYSSTSIENLMSDGYCDALTTIGIQSIREGLTSIKRKTFKDDKNLEKLEGHIQQIEKSIKVGNSCDPLIINQIEVLESMLDEVRHD